MRHFLGVDPGKSGGAALINESYQVESVIKFAETERDIANWFDSVTSDYRSLRFAVIERVHSSPQMGVKSAFSFGQSYGFLRGLLIAYGLRFEAVTPHKWQKALGCLSRGQKNVTKAKAQEIFPGVKVTHAIADALLLAAFALRQEMR